jgi:UDP-galactopyranose mutase
VTRVVNPAIRFTLRLRGAPRQQISISVRLRREDLYWLSCYDGDPFEAYLKEMVQSIVDDDRIRFRIDNLQSMRRLAHRLAVVEAKAYEAERS